MFIYSLYNRTDHRQRFFTGIKGVTKYLRSQHAASQYSDGKLLVFDTGSAGVYDITVDNLQMIFAVAQEAVSEHVGAVATFRVRSKFMWMEYETEYSLSEQYVEEDEIED